MRYTGGSKAVKLPSELITLLESDGIIRQQGDLLYKAYKEYMVVKTLTDTMRVRYGISDRDLSMAQVIMQGFAIESRNMESLRAEHKKILQEVDELKRMLDGFQIYIKKTG